MSGEFPPQVRAEIIARDTPLEGGLPRCTACGEPARDPVIHHLLSRARCDGSEVTNGVVVHGRLEAGQCHHTRIHEDVAAAEARGLIRRSYDDPDDVVIECGWRGRIRLLPDGSWEPVGWRVFHGQWGQWAHTDETFPVWLNAQAAAMRILAGFTQDRCQVRREQAAAALRQLTGLPDDSSFWTEIDGEDIRLARADDSERIPGGNPDAVTARANLTQMNKTMGNWPDTTKGPAQ